MRSVESASPCLPSRERARGQRADHLRDVEAADRAVLEDREHRAAHVRHDRALAVAGRSHADLGLHPAVQLVEIGHAAEQGKRAHVGQIRAQREDGIAGRRIDRQVAIGVAVIGAEIFDINLQHAAGERGVERGGCEAAVADADLGRGNPRLRIDIVQAVEVDRGIAPGLRARPAAARRHRDRQSLEVEVEFHERLARDIDRGPAIEGAVVQCAADAVDHHNRTVEPHFGLRGQRCLQQAGGLEFEFGRNALPLDRRRGRARLDLEFQRLAGGARIARDRELAVAAHGGVGIDGLDAVLDAVAQIGHHQRAAGDADMLDRDAAGSIGGGRPGGRIGFARRAAAVP